MAGDLKAQLEISADASGVEAGVGKAKRSLADLGATASAAGKDAAAGISGIGAGGEKASAKIETATRTIIRSIERATVALDTGGRSSAKYFELLANQRGVDVGALRPYLDQLDAVAAKQKIAATAITATTPVLTEFGMSARATAAAMRQVPAQFTDIVTSIQGGQKPLTVLLQQGGQLKDVFGGVGPAARALGGYVVGLINPFTLLAAAAAAVAFAYHQGSEEGNAYAKALILSGNAAGTTTGQLQAMAKRIDGIIGTQGAAAEALAQFAASGEIAGSSLERFTTVALKFERETGQAISKTVEQFGELAKAPVAASIKLNEATNFLTLSLYRQIKALEEQGRTAEAAALAQKGYADALEQRSGQIEARLGTIERLWRGIKDAAKDAWDAMLNVGRPNTLQGDLAKAQGELEARLQRGPLNSSPGVAASFEKGNAALRDRIAVLSESIRLDDRAALSTKAAADQVKARIAFDKEADQFLTKAVKLERELTEARNKGQAAGASQAEIEKVLAGIREKYADKGGARTALAIDKAQLGLDIADIKAATDKLVGSFVNAEQILEAQRAAGLLSERDYYAKKREFITIEIELKDYALEREIARMQQEKLTGKDKLDNDKKIAEAEGKLAILRADASARLAVLSTQEEAAAKKLQAGYLAARQAAQDFFDAATRAQDRDLAGIGQGVQQRSLNAGVSQIEERYAQQRRDLENQKAQLQLEDRFTDDARAQYEERLRIVNEFQEKSLSSYTGYYAELMRKQGDWALGANEALKNYQDRVGNTFESTKEVVDHAFKGMEDSLVAFITTGKGGFHSLVDSIVAGIIRITVQQQLLRPLSSYLSGGSDSGGWISSALGLVGSFFGGANTSDFRGTTLPDSLRGGRAGGGPVSAGGLYRVNERGPGEVFNVGGNQYLMAGANGTVAPASAGGGRVVHQTIHFSSNQPTSKQTQGQLAAAALAGLRRGERDS